MRPATSTCAWVHQIACARTLLRALDAGFDMHLANPIEPSELIAVVANLGRMAKALRVGR